MGLPANWKAKSIHKKVELMAQGLWGGAGGVTTTALGIGVGTTASPFAFGTMAGKRYVDIRTSCAATSGSSYGGYFSHKVIGAAGSGAGLRGYGYAYGAEAVTIYGGEFTGEIHSSANSAVSGLIAGIRGICSIQGTATGTLAALDLLYDVANGKDATAVSNAFVRVSNTGSGTGCNALVNIAVAKGTTSATALSSTNHDAPTADTMIRCLIDGTPHWILATTHAPAGS